MLVVVRWMVWWMMFMVVRWMVWWMRCYIIYIIILLSRDDRISLNWLGANLVRVVVLLDVKSSVCLVIALHLFHKIIIHKNF
eukprot:UN04848